MNERAKAWIGFAAIAIAFAAEACVRRAALTEPNQPPNQPAVRFRGHPPTAARTPDPLPAWLGAAPVMLAAPILEPSPDAPPWMQRAIYNPTAIVAPDRTGADVVHLLLRVEEQPRPGGWPTSRIAHAQSRDGFAFEVDGVVIEPSGPYEDSVEDPRVVEISGRYHVTYTAFRLRDRTARLSHAVSNDLVHWIKLGPMFPDGTLRIRTENPNKNWSKAGAILAKPIHGKFCMWFGDEAIYLATADRPEGPWTAEAEPVLRPRPGYFDGIMVEPGPAPTLDDDGNVLLLYNADGNPRGYEPGWAVFAGDDPTRVVRRSNTPIPGLGITHAWQRTGQVGQVSFLSGAVRFQGKHLFYTGAADSKTGVAWAPLSREARR
jgi:beta-1,2-mannosidase